MHLYYDIYIYMSYTKYISNFEFITIVMTLEIREKEICRSTNFSKRNTLHRIARDPIWIVVPE